jgi:hypothetical protein
MNRIAARALKRGTSIDFNCQLAGVDSPTRPTPFALVVVKALRRRL